MARARQVQTGEWLPERLGLRTARWRGRYLARGQRLHLGTRLQAELAFGDDLFAQLEALADQHVAVADFGRGFHGLHLDSVIALHEVHVVAIRATLHRLRGNHEAVLHGTDLGSQRARSDECSSRTLRAQC